MTPDTDSDGCTAEDKHKDVVARLNDSAFYRATEPTDDQQLGGCDECGRDAVAVVRFAEDSEGKQVVCQYHANELLEVTA